MLVYGPSARGALRALADQLGAQTLSDLSKPVGLSWEEFTLDTLGAAAASGERVLFDLTHIADIAGVLAGNGPHARTITGIELRHIRDNWGQYEDTVQFHENGEMRVAPWLRP